MIRITANPNEHAAKKKNGKTNPPNWYKADPNIGPPKNPRDVETSAIAIFSSIDFGNN